jgi:ankyrin repeat protein
MENIMTDKLQEQTITENANTAAITTPIWEAAVNNDWDTVKECLRRDPSLINITGMDEGYEMSLLHLAIGQESDIELVEYLVSQGADVNVQYNVRNTDIDEKGEVRRFFTSPTPPPLHFAIIQDNANVDVVLFLMGQGADVNAADCYGKTPLHYAAMRKSDIDAMTFFVDRGGNVKEEADWTPLDQAADDNRKAEILKSLIMQGADVHVRDHEHKIPLDYADTVEKRYILREAMRQVLSHHRTVHPIPRPSELHVHVHIHTGNFSDTCYPSGHHYPQ